MQISLCVFVITCDWDKYSEFKIKSPHSVLYPDHGKFIFLQQKSYKNIPTAHPHYSDQKGEEKKNDFILNMSARADILFPDFFNSHVK